MAPNAGFSFASALRRLVVFREGEGPALALSALFFFLLLTSYFLLRPVRETMGLRGGMENLPWLYMWTLGGVLALTPVYTALVKRRPRRVFIPWVYGFFILNLLLFYGAEKLVPEVGDRRALGYAFFVWLSVFNVFAVVVFRSFMADIWTSEQGRRLFGFIGIGGTLGAMVGSGATGALLGWEVVGVPELMLISAALLGASVLVFLALVRLRIEGGAGAGDGGPGRVEPMGVGNALRAFELVARSPYMLGICLFIILYAVTSTLIYFAEVRLVSEAAVSEADRARLFAIINLIQQTATILAQAFLAGRVKRSLGVGMTLAILPLVTLVGFAAFAAAPVLGVIVALSAARRSANFAFSRPAREVLFTVLTPEEKYKAKALIDTFVYRGGDVLGAALFAAMSWAGIALAGVAAIVAVASLGWAGLALALGRRQRAMEAPDAAHA